MYWNTIMPSSSDTEHNTVKEHEVFAVKAPHHKVRRSGIVT